MKREHVIEANSFSGIDGFNVADVNPKHFCKVLLFGDQNLGTIANRIILETTISFIKASARFNTKFQQQQPLVFLHFSFDGVTFS